MISFSEILSPIRHEASHPQIFLTVCSGTPYYEAYMGRACKTREIPISGKRQNRNFDYRIVISVKNPEFIL